MTDLPAPPPPAPAPLPCPVCRDGRLPGEGTVRCDRRGCEVVVHRFAPVRDHAGAGAGRCARHPTKDGVAGCERCGAFVCEVCLTRTGSRVLCPACFDVMHERGDLATTRTSRFRPDYLAVSLLPLALCWGVSLPFSFAFAIHGLRRRRQEPWLSKPMLLSALLVSSAALLVAVGLIVAAIVGAG